MTTALKSLLEESKAARELAYRPDSKRFIEFLPNGYWGIFCLEGEIDRFLAEKIGTEEDACYMEKSCNTSAAKDAIIKMLVEALELLLNDGVWHKETMRRHVLDTLAHVEILAKEGLGK